MASVYGRQLCVVAVYMCEASIVRRDKGSKEKKGKENWQASAPF